MSADATRTCRGCGASLAGRRPSARYCKDACRKRVDRGGSLVEDITPSGLARPDSLLEATRAALTAVDRLGTPHGVAAVGLAARIDSAVDTGAGLASLHKAWSTAFGAATANTSAVVSPLDELRLRREQRRGA